MQDRNGKFSRYSETKSKNLAVNPQDYELDPQVDVVCASIIGKNSPDLVYFAR